MTTTDIIPDIHGQLEKLLFALRRLGWRRTAAGWVHPDPGRRILFLGDFIDRGPDNAGVLRTVRELMDTDKADAVMGNHELNAVLFHSVHPEDGLPLRPHMEKNIRQHRAFLNEFDLGAPDTREVIAWMASLPLFIDTGEFRAVHASWTASAIGRLTELTENGVLSEEHFVRSAGRDEADEVFRIVETTTKGPEARLPAGCGVSDKEGVLRTNVRMKWWVDRADKWRDIAISVPNMEELPEGAPEGGFDYESYPQEEKPVFFGHYWLQGTPEVQARNVLCLDYSAGLDGPLASYEHRSGDMVVHADRIRMHAA
jgi:hypothetical protein